MNVNFITKLIIICCLTLTIVTVTNGQDGEQTRSITSDDFVKSRPVRVQRIAKSNGRSAVSTKKRVTYNLVKRDKNQIRWKSSSVSDRLKTLSPRDLMISSDIGVTIWKMRRPLISDTGVKLPVKVGGGIEMWSSVRVDPFAAFKTGDLIRLAIESPVRGYLYVINSEIGSDGSFGDPSLIFPAPADQYNLVSPGMLVDIPDQNEQFPYFKMEPKKENYSGELLAVVITPVKLNFQLDERGKILNIGSIIDLDLAVDVQIFGRMDTQDQVYTQAEADAACGSKSRELVREKIEQNPCGVKSRNLTRDEPLPQTIYRVKTYSGRPAVALIQLGVTK